MLNQLIARYLVVALEPLDGPVISRLSGLVKTLETDAYTPGKLARFPIAVEAEDNACAVSEKSFPDLVPDRNERLIIYFEDFGSVNNSGKWTSRLRLIAWGNNTLFEGVAGYAVPTVLISKITRLLERKTLVGYDSPVDSLRCSVLGSPAADTNLFGKYTYSETRSQYLLPPYFAFGLDLQLTFVLNDDCLTNLTGKPVPGCD